LCSKVIFFSKTKITFAGHFIDPFSTLGNFLVLLQGIKYATQTLREQIVDIAQYYDMDNNHN